ncbi:MAG: AMP-binding protein [Deltaproteobacteria bacterium]|nr:AMP-binding protein [Deltaproteobacteria bacterium]
MGKGDITRCRVIHHVLRQKAREFGNRPFLYFEDRTFGYEELDAASDRAAAGLLALGLRMGDKVALMMGNRPEFLFMWFGISKVGAVEVPINVAHRGDILTYMLDKADCRVVIAEAAFLDQLAPAIEGLSKVERLVILDDPGEKKASLTTLWVDFRKLMDNDGSYQAVDVTWADPFAILFTSGTTGPSKGALMPHNYALFMGELVMGFAEYTESDCLYNALPLFHGNAQLLSAMPALMSGARMVLARRFSASRFWSEVEKYQCTAFNYIGSIIPILLKAAPKAEDSRNPLRIMVGGGCPEDLFGVVEARFGLSLVEGYGMSELGLPLGNGPGQHKRGTIGKPTPGYQVKVVADNGLEVSPGILGELLVRPEKPYTMMLEYYRMPEETVEAWRDLWFHTGDYVVEDPEGYFRFVDRKKDALRRGGENISSYEVEKIINSHPAVRDSAAIAVKSELAEDEVMVCLELSPDAGLTPEALLDYCQECMAYFMVPRYVRIMETLPRTPTLRVQKAVLRREGITADTWDRVKTGYEIRR